MAYTKFAPKTGDMEKAWKQDPKQPALAPQPPQTPEETRLKKTIKALKKQAAAPVERPLVAADIKWIIDRVTPVFKTEASLVEVETPVSICGDVHGQFVDVVRLFNQHGWPPKTRYLFLGFISSFYGIEAGQERIANALKEANPGYAANRLRGMDKQVHPARYVCSGFGQNLHIDQNEKVVHYGVVTTIAIDGYSSYITGYAVMSIKSNIVIYRDMFRPIVQQFGAFRKVYADHGREFYLTGFMQQYFTHCTRGPAAVETSFVQTKSTSNVRVERCWVEVNRRIGYALRESFTELEQRGLADKDDQGHLYSMSLIGQWLARYAMSIWIPAWNSHPIEGDYVDRGPRNIETICLLFALKVLNPTWLYLLRGNHETKDINRVYGFYDEIMKKYDCSTYDQFNEAFNWMPLAGLVSGSILCMHGGISPSMTSLDDIRKIPRPLEKVPPQGLVTDLLWADPDKNVRGFVPSSRGISQLFGEDAVVATCERLGVDMVARAHQVIPMGYEFFAGGQLVTLFTAPDYCGQFANDGAVLNVDKELGCAIKRLPSTMKTQAKPVTK